MPQLWTRRSNIPGSRFTPRDPELIHHLRRKVERGKSCCFITDMDVYEKEPWLLQHVRHFRSRENEWFYFVTRRKLPQIKKEDSKRTSRTVAGFTWKSSTTNPVEENGVKVGSVTNLSFMVKGKAIGWVMHEYLLDKPGFEEVVLCSIRFKPAKDNSNAQYAPRLEPIVVGQPQLPREEGARADGLTLGENKKKNLSVAVQEDMNVQIETHLGMEHQQQQWIGSFPGEAFSYSTAQHGQFMKQNSNFLMNVDMKQQQDFGSCEHFLGAQQWDHSWVQETDPSHSAEAMKEHQLTGYPVEVVPHSDKPYYQGMVSVTQCMMEHQEFGASAQRFCLAQNHHSVVPMETHQGMEPHQHNNSCFDHNVARNQTREAPYLTQEQKQPCEQATDLPINQGIEEPHRGIADSLSHNELFQQYLKEMDEPTMTNFGDEEWAKALGENTPEEEAELTAGLGNCNTFDSLFDYFSLK